MACNNKLLLEKINAMTNWGNSTDDLIRRGKSDRYRDKKKKFDKWIVEKEKLQPDNNSAKVEGRDWKVFVKSLWLQRWINGFNELLF